MCVCPSYQWRINKDHFCQSQVSRRSLGLAAGLGAGLVTAGLGLLSLLRILSKKYCKAIKSEPGQQHKTEEK